MYISFGDKERVFIECVVEYVFEDRNYGRFRLWANNRAIGNWDEITHLDGVVSWLKYESLPLNSNRREDRLINKSIFEIFATIYDPVMDEKLTTMLPLFSIEDSYGRFHISHIGLSSFNDFAVLLIESIATQRILWFSFLEAKFYDAVFPASVLQTAFANFSKKYDEYQKSNLWPRAS
jgi:hypothetical protein